jgi:hypothetical protein
MRKISTKKFDRQQLLQRAISTFRHAAKCQNPDFCRGYCDTIAHVFLQHAQTLGLKGKLLAVDNPNKKPTHGWDHWGGHWKNTGGCISHYIAYFPALGQTVDWTARQFWARAPVPLIETLEQTKARWNQLPFGTKDSREEESDTLDYDFKDTDFPEYDDRGNLKLSSVTAHNPSGEYMYRVHPKGDIHRVLKDGLYSYSPADGPGAPVDFPEYDRWPGQDVETDPQTSRLYLADKQWDIDTWEQEDSRWHDRFRIRIPKHHVEGRMEPDDQMGDGDHFIDTGEGNEQLLEPHQYDIDMGRGQWVRGDHAQDIMAKSWHHLYHKGPGSMGYRIYPEEDES